MKKNLLIGFLALAVLAAGWLWTGYNGLVSVQGSVGIAWSQVQADYQRRFDLIPNLQATVEGAANFERSTFTDVVKARTAWQSATQAGNQAGQLAAVSAFDGALSRLLVTVEAYPQLQATQAFRDFMTQLEGTENRISTSRKDYNAAVGAYNIKIRRFPTNVLAGLFGFDPASSFAAEAGAEQAPKVTFGAQASQATTSAASSMAN
jgi:LemA protein